MTKRTFELVARILRENADASGSMSRDAVAMEFADAFAEQNPAFDRARFLHASGVPGYDKPKRRKRAQQWRVGDGTVCDSLEEARKYADSIARRTNVILAVERIG